MSSAPPAASDENSSSRLSMSRAAAIGAATFAASGRNPSESSGALAVTAGIGAAILLAQTIADWKPFVARKERLGCIQFTVSRSGVAVVAAPSFPAWSDFAHEFGALVQEVVAGGAGAGAEALVATLASDWQARADACLHHRRITVQLEAVTRLIGSDFVVLTFWRNIVSDEANAPGAPASAPAEPGAVSAPASQRVELDESVYRPLPSAPPAPVDAF